MMRPLLLCVLLLFTSCVQAPSTPTPSPEPRVKYPSELLRQVNWVLLEYTKDGQPVDVAPVMPVYLDFGYVSNSPSASLQVECYDNHESPKRFGYRVQFVSDNQFEMVDGLTTDNQCSPDREPYVNQVGALGRYLTSYVIEGDTLVLRGIDQNSGAEIVTRWRR